MNKKELQSKNTHSTSPRRPSFRQQTKLLKVTTKDRRSPTLRIAVPSPQSRARPVPCRPGSSTKDQLDVLQLIYIFDVPQRWILSSEDFTHLRIILKKNGTLDRPGRIMPGDLGMSFHGGMQRTWARADPPSSLSPALRSIQALTRRMLPAVSVGAVEHPSVPLQASPARLPPTVA